MTHIFSRMLPKLMIEIHAVLDLNKTENPSNVLTREHYTSLLHWV
jgi:hypothetical protein